jgi:hypothetical protein
MMQELSSDELEQVEVAKPSINEWRRAGTTLAGFMQSMDSRNVSQGKSNYSDDDITDAIQSLDGNAYEIVNRIEKVTQNKEIQSDDVAHISSHLKALNETVGKYSNILGSYYTGLLNEITNDVDSLLDREQGGHERAAPKAEASLSSGKPAVLKGSFNDWTNHMRSAIAVSRMIAGSPQAIKGDEKAKTAFNEIADTITLAYRQSVENVVQVSKTNDPQKIETAINSAASQFAAATLYIESAMGQKGENNQKLIELSSSASRIFAGVLVPLNQLMSDELNGGERAPSNISKVHYNKYIKPSA